MKSRRDFITDSEYVEYLRTYIATVIMQGFCAKEAFRISYCREFIESAVEVTDKLIAELNKSK